MRQLLKKRIFIDCLHDLSGELFDEGEDGFGPAAVAFGARVEQVGHDGFGEGASLIFFEEDVVDIEPEDAFAVGVFFDFGVDAFVFLACGIVFIGSSGEDSEEEDFGLRLGFLEGFEDFLYAFCGVSGFVAPVVGADHEDDELGVHLSAEIAAFDAPEDVFGFVAGDAEIDGVERGEMRFPADAAGDFPVVRDGVAEEDDFGVALLGDDVECGVARFPPFLAFAACGNAGFGFLRFFGLGRCGGEEAEAGGGEEGA